MSIDPRAGKGISKHQRVPAALGPQSSDTSLANSQPVKLAYLERVVLAHFVYELLSVGR